VKRRVASLLAVVLLAPAGAQASTTIGSSLRQRANLFTRCDAVAAGACTELQAQAGAARLAAPAEGVISRWRVRASTLGGARLRVLHPAADGALSVVDTTGWVELDRRHGPGADVRYEFPARISVLAGDVIALDRTRRAGGVFHTYGADASWRAAQFDPLLALDAAGAQPSSVGIGRELLLNADVENDRDNDGFGDETQDNCPTIANDQTDNPCPAGRQTGGTDADTGGDDATSTVIAAPRRFQRHRKRPAPRPLPSRAPRGSGFGAR
jgi:hypothetical protein